MEEFQLDDLGFNFDFGADFDRNESQIINELLTESYKIETTDLQLETAESFVNDESKSMFFEYLNEDFDANADFSNLDSIDFPADFANLNEFESTFGSSSLNVNESTNLISRKENKEDDASGIECVPFDWSSFFQQSPSHEVIVDNSDFQINESVSEANNSNGIVYEELTDLNVPKLFNDLESKFELMELKAIDNEIKYADLINCASENVEMCATENVEQNQKLYIFPMTDDMCDGNFNHVVNRFEIEPSIVESLLNKCSGHLSIGNIIVFQREPNQTKQKSTKFPSTAERFSKINQQEVVLPMIEQCLRKRQRKQVIVLDPTSRTKDKIAAAGGDKKPTITRKRSIKAKNMKENVATLAEKKPSRRSQRCRT